MSKEEIKKALEAILFTLGDAVEIKRLAKALETDEKHIREAADEMIADMNAEDRGITIIEIDGSYQMCTKKDAYEYLLKIVAVPKENRLTDVQLETLSIIAYKQPITKIEIEKIRGVNANHAVNRLVELGLVEEKGRLNAPGRPFLFGTSDIFLRRFGLTNLERLPDINAEKVEDFKIEAEEELGYSGDEIIDVET